MGKSSPSPPSAPDPNVVAAAQGKANIEAARTVTALNRANQVGPLGSSTWTQTPNKGTLNKGAYDAATAAYNKGLAERTAAAANAPAAGPVWKDGGGDAGGSWVSGQGGAPVDTGTTPPPPREEDFMEGVNPDSWTQTTTLDPRSQKLLDAQLESQQALTGVTKDATNRVADAFKTGIDYSKAPGVMDPMMMLAGVTANMADQKDNIRTSGAVADTARGVAGDKIAAFGAKNALNFDNATPRAGTDEEIRKQVQDAMYSRATARLDPRFADRQSALDVRLANQGITQGSEAYERALRNEAFDRNDAYSSATNDSITAGEAAVNADFQRKFANRGQSTAEELALNDAIGRDASLGAALAGQTAGTELAYTGQDLAQKQAAPQIAGAAYGLQTADRARVLAEEEKKRALVLNELNALRTGGQVQMPQFGQTPSGANVAPAPIAQAMQNKYSSDLANYNAETAGGNNMLGGLVSLGGSFLGGPGGAMVGKAIGSLFG
jgi:hypothetical protein